MKKIAIVHDWLMSQRGGENVLDAICELFPKAELFTLFYTPGVVSPNILRLTRHTSILNRFSAVRSRYRHTLPLMPWAVERFNLSEFDLIISSSHCVAKGIKKRPDAIHISYVHAPMRYMWERFDEYFSKDRAGLLTRTAAHIFRPYLQNWDKKSSENVDYFFCNSQFIAEKIKNYYQREAQVIYPFCEPDELATARKPSSSYLMVTALVPYKRVDLAIEAFNRMNKPLVIVGDGPDKKRLQKLAGPKIEFLNGLKRRSLADMYSKCKALVFPGIEDFGIVPIEAMAAGAPVIAFGQGGALETITEKTGVFFYEPTPESLIQAVEKFEEMNQKNLFSELECRSRGRLFNRLRFQKEFLQAVETSLKTSKLNEETIKQTMQVTL